MTTEQTIQDVAMIARNGIDRVIELERMNGFLVCVNYTRFWFTQESLASNALYSIPESELPQIDVNGSLRSLRGLRDLCDKLIAARTAPPKKRAKKRS